jgi:hypothetical protein
MSRRLPSKRRLLLYTAGTVLVLLVLAQLLLPHIAADRIRSRVDRYGQVKSVSVSAWPAIELLWGHADSVHVHAGALALPTSRIAPLLHEAKDASSLTFTAESVRLGGLRLTDVSLDKQDERLRAQARASAADVQAALPPGVSVALLGSHGGEVEVRARGGLFGVSASLNAVAQASSGRIVVHPEGFLLGALGVTLYSDPRVYVVGVGARADGRLPPGYVLNVAAVLR